MEAEANWKPVPNLTLGAGLSLLHSSIRDKTTEVQICALNNAVFCTPSAAVRPVPGAFGTTFLVKIDG